MFGWRSVPDLIQWWVSVRWNKVVWTESFHRQPESELHESFLLVYWRLCWQTEMDSCHSPKQLGLKISSAPPLSCLFTRLINQKSSCCHTHVQNHKLVNQHIDTYSVSPSFLSRSPRFLNNPDHVLLFPEGRLKVTLWFCFAPCRSGQWLSVARPQRQDVWERLQMDGRQADGKTVLLDRSVDAPWKLHFNSAEAAEVHTFSPPVEVQIL